jgi:hypothetical protein
MGVWVDMWGHHDLASSLSQQGYIVVSVTHLGDNFQDASGIGATSTPYGRSLQISAALADAILVQSDALMYVVLRRGGKVRRYLVKEKWGFEF